MPQISQEQQLIGSVRHWGIYFQFFEPIILQKYCSFCLLATVRVIQSSHELTPLTNYRGKTYYTIYFEKDKVHSDEYEVRVFNSRSLLFR